jgi:hypothetical protein
MGESHSFMPFAWCDCRYSSEFDHLAICLSCRRSTKLSLRPHTSCALIGVKREEKLTILSPGLFSNVCSPFLPFRKPYFLDVSASRQI